MLKPEDFVGWTVVVRENPVLCPTGIFYCVGTYGTKTLWVHDSRWEDKDGSLAEMDIYGWSIGIEYVSRLRMGDHRV